MIHIPEEIVKKFEDKTAAVRDLSVGISDAAAARFKRFCREILGTEVDEVPSEESIFMRQSLAIVRYATILFLLTNGLYLVKNLVMRTMITIDMVPLYMMVASSLGMLLFLSFYKKYGSPLSRYVLLAFYTIVVASVTVFMVSCNYHNIGLSISMCYLFIIMVAPTYKLFDTVVICVLISVSWWLPDVLPYSENYNLFKHFLLRFAVVVGFFAVRSVFMRQASTERRVKEMSNSFVKLAYNDVMTGTLNKKAMEAYRAYVTEHLSPERVSVIIYDVDNFKSYNDHYSHMKGDEALRLVSESVVGVLEREGRYLFRFGGEEFVVILPDVAEDDARELAVELLGAVRAAAIPRDDLENEPDALNVPDIPDIPTDSDASTAPSTQNTPNAPTKASLKRIVTASFGIACGTGAELGDLSIIAKADRQLYVCKNGGKDCVAAGGVIYR